MGAGEQVRSYMRCIAQTLEALPWEAVERAIALLHEARLRRATVFLCGNGGSAATAMHWANDLGKGAEAPGVPRFRAISLVDNVSLLTAWSNDASYAEAFAEQLRNLARPGDVLLALSGSGNSPNVLNAVRLARELGLATVGLSGGQGGELAKLVDLAIVVPNACMEQIEDVHMLLEHAITSALRERARSERVPSLLLAEGGPRHVDVPRRGAIFLDRDGVINADRPDYVKSWEEFALLPGALEALRELSATRMPIVVITNQSAINRGLTSFEVVESINRRLMALVAEAGGRIEAVAWCPHRPEEQCGCRKPAPGLLHYAAEALRLDLARSYLVGDAESDIAAGMAAGCKSLLVLTGRGAAQRAKVEERWGARCVIVPDLMAAARWILRDLESEHG